MGGLGNQMFQYAFARSFSIQNNCDVTVNIDWFYKALYAKMRVMCKSTKEKYVNHAQYSHAGYQLDIFNTQYRYNIISDIQSRIACGAFNLDKQTKYNVLKEDVWTAKMSFIQEYLDQPTNTIFNGYFADYRYFHKYKDVLLKEFSPKVRLSSQFERYNKQIQAVDSIALHVRRGDYVTNKDCQKIFHVCNSENYYNKALDIIKQKVSNPHIFVFSNDMKWVRENIDIPFHKTYVAYTTEKNAYEDIMLMSKCKHNIIANSSFSWWGAYLNRNQDQIVIMPEKGFKEEEMHYLSNGMRVSSWIAI